MTKKNDIIVLGAGYAGLMTALRIAGKLKVKQASVTLINAKDSFVERPRLHEQATTDVLIEKPIAEMIKGRHIQFVKGWVEKIVPNENCIHVKTAVSQQTLHYDILVNALGSQVARTTIKGVDQFAYTLDPYGRLTTEDLKKHLTQFSKRPFRAVVVGGGATGVEMAAQLKSIYPNCTAIIITQNKVGDFKDAKVQQQIGQSLTEQGVEIIENGRVTEVVADGVILPTSKIDADLVIWAGGFVASPLAKEAGLKVNAQQQTLVDPQLRSISHPNIYAAGDAAFPVEAPGVPIRMALFAALVSGAQAADNIVALIKGKEQQPLSFAWYGQGVALGTKDAVGFMTYPLDQRSGPILRRKTAVYLRNFFVWYLKCTLELERRIPGYFFWTGKKRYMQQQKRLIQVQHQS